MINELTNRTPSNQIGTVSKSIKISNEDITFERKDNIFLLKDDPLPDISNNLYLVYANKSGAITHIVFNFRDYAREISIQGNSNEAVESMHLLLSDKLLKKTIIMGGGTFRIIVYFTLCLIGGALIISGCLPHIKLLNYQRVVIIVFGFLSIIFSFVQLILGSKWFPGFVLYKESNSYIFNYSAEISFFGVILTVLLFPIGIYFSYRFSAKGKISKEE